MKKIYSLILFLVTFYAFPQSPDCSTASAMCSGQGGPYLNTHNGTVGGNQTGYGSIAGCGGSGSLGNNGSLGSTPRPAWFTLQIGTSGPIELNLVQTSTTGNGIDVDFALWGPFTNGDLSTMCNSLSNFPGSTYTGPCNLVDASYSGTYDEYIHIPNAQAGETYLLLVTNYNGSQGSYTINQTSQTPSSGQISCEIVCGIDLGVDQYLCNISSTTLEANFNQTPTTAGTPTYTWYLNGGSPITTTTNTLTVTQSGTWSVEVVRPGCSDVSTDDVEVYFSSTPVVNTPNPQTITVSGTFDLTSLIPALVAPNDPANYTVYFYLDQADCWAANSNYIADPENFTTTGPTDVFFHVSSGSVQDTMCGNSDEYITIIGATCSLSLTSAAGTDGQTICINDPITDIVLSYGDSATGATITGLPSGLTAIDDTNGTYTISGTPDAAGNYNMTVSTVGCSTELTYPLSLNVIDPPTLSSITGATPICSGEDAVFTLVGTADATVAYNVNGASDTIVLDASGNGVVTINTTTTTTDNQVMTLSDITLGSCSTTLTDSYTIVVNPLPVFTNLTSNSPICEGEDAVFTFEGSANAYVNYTLNGASGTIGLGATGQNTLTVATTNDTDQQVVITNVTLNACSVTDTTSETVVVNVQPVVTSVGGTTPICSGEDAVFTLVGTADATVSYDVNGASGTALLDASGNGSVTITTTDDTDQVITLNDITLGSCSTTLIDTYTIGVNLTPSITNLTSNTPICEGEDAVFTFEGTANADVNYTLNGVAASINLGATGQNTLTVTTTDDTDQVVLLTDITLNGCTATETATETVVVNVQPVVTSVGGTTPICSGEDAVFTLVGTADATVSYDVNGASGTALLDASGNGSVTITTTDDTDQVITLNDITLGSCSTTLIDTYTIVVNLTPSFASLTSNTPICEGEDAVFTFEGTANADVNYTLNGVAASINLGATGQNTLTVTTTDYTDQVVLLTDITLNGCTATETATETVVVNVQPVVTSVGGTTPICSGEDAVFTLVGTADATVSYDVNGASGTALLDASGNGSVTITTTDDTDQVITLNDITLGSCSTTLTDTYTIVVNPVPVFTGLTSNTPICEGEDAVFTFEGTADADVNYTLNGVAASINLGATGQNTLTVTTTDDTDQVVLLTDITLNGCTATETATETVVVNVQPLVTSIGGTTPICPGEDAVFTLVGTADATVSYDVNGAAGTALLDASGNGSVTITTTDDTDQVITLSDITLGSCSTTLTDTYTIVVNPLPTFTSLTSNTPICEGEDAVFTFEGTADADVNYTLNGVAASINLGATGQNTLTVTTTDDIDQVVLLTDITLNGCTATETATETVVVNPLPSVSTISNNGAICEGETAVFTINGTPNSTVTYTLDGGTSTATLNIPASGSTTVTVTGVTANMTIDLIDITNDVTTCSATIANTNTITVNPSPTATIAAASNLVCLNGTTTLTFTGTAGATVDFTDGTTTYDLTIGTTGTVDYTTPALTTDTTYTLTSVTSNTTPACSVPLTDSQTISINPTPEVIINSFDDAICNGTLTDIAYTLNNATGLQWQATLSNVYFGDPSTSSGDQDNLNQVATLINPLVEGNITIQILPVLTGGDCVGEYETIVINVNPIPTVDEIIPSTTSICDGENVTFTIAASPSGATFQWTAILDGVVTQDGVVSGTTDATVSLDLDLTNASQAGELYIDVTPILEDCTGDTLSSAVITVNPIPGAVVSSPSYPICSGESASSAFNISLGFPLVTDTTVEWEIFDSSGVTGYSSGSAATTPFEIPDVLTTTGTTQGYVTYRIWTISPAGCTGEYTDFTVYVNPNPEPSLQGGSICVDTDGNVFQTFWLQATGNFETTTEFEWYETTNTTSPIAVTTVAQLEVDQAGNYYVVATNADGCYGISDTVSVIETNPATSVTAEVTEAFSDSATVIVTVTGSTNGTLLYQMDEGDYQSESVFTDVSSGEHTITVVDAEGCTYLTTTVMVVDYPKFFTPNGDGYNDTWNISGLNQTNARLYIFDRYGKLIKQLSPSDASSGWDGTFNGKQLPSTDYWFSLQYEEDGVAKELKAHFSLKR